MKRLALLLIALVALAGSGVATAGTKAKNTSGVVFAGATHQEGNDLYIAGDFKDKVLGRGAIVYTTRVRPGTAPGSFKVTARKVVIYTTKGSFSGKGSATQTTGPGDTSRVTDGVVTLKKGTGRYRGKRFDAKFTGDFKEGVYKFDYTGRIR